MSIMRAGAPSRVKLRLKRVPKSMERTLLGVLRVVGVSMFFCARGLAQTEERHAEVVTAKRINDLRSMVVVVVA
jgi:hypothetical protein